MLATLLKAAIPTTPDITLEDTIKLESSYSKKSSFHYMEKKVKAPMKSIDIEEPISMKFINTNQNIKKELPKNIKTIQKPVENIDLKPNFEHSTISSAKTVQNIEPIGFVPLKQLIPSNNIAEKWTTVQELPNNVNLKSNIEYGFINGINITPEPVQPMQYTNVNPNTGYSITVNEQKTENSYSIDGNITITTDEKVYSIERNVTITRGEDGKFNTCIRGKVTINAKYIGHSSTTIPAEEEIKFVIENTSLDVNQLYVERSDWENILDIYKNSLIERLPNFNINTINMVFLNAGIRSIKYLLDKYFPSLGEKTEKWKQQKDEFFESSMEKMREFYAEHPETGDDFAKMLVGMEIDETQLNPLEKAILAREALKAGIVKDVASGVNGIIDVVLSPLETLDALTSPNAGEMLWEGLTEDIVNDWQKGTVQGMSQATGRVISMLLPIEELKAVGTAGKMGKTGGVLTKLGRKVSGKSGIGVEISKPIKEINIKKVEFPKTPVKYGDHYRKVDGKNSLKPDIEYVDGNNYKYTTDSQGRISRVEGELKLQKGKRNSNAQREIGQKKDDGGHLIANRFGGSGEIDNLVPQNKHLNRSGGEWYKMEQEWANALKEGKKVEVDIQPIYSGTSTRPDSFSVHYKIDGKETIRRMANPKEP